MENRSVSKEEDKKTSLENPATKVRFLQKDGLSRPNKSKGKTLCEMILTPYQMAAGYR